MDNMLRIKRMSGRLRTVSGLMFWATPLFCAIYWIYLNEFPDVLKDPSILTWPQGLPALNRGLCFAATMLPAGVAMYGFSVLGALFGLYAAGELFSERNVSCYHKLGRTLLYWAGAGFLHTTLISLAISVGKPQGQRHVTVLLDSIELMALFAGAAALVISWVMDEGRGIEEERALTI